MLRIALACSLIALASSPSSARDQVGQSESGRSASYTKAAVGDTATPRDTVVVSAPSLRAWSANMSKVLAKTMRYPHSFSNELTPEGLAWVRFKCSEIGAPTGVELARGSGDPRIDRAALSAVRRIKTLHPLAAGIKHDQSYVAALIFANSRESRKRQMQVFREQMASRAYTGPSREAALAIAPSFGTD